MKGAQSDSPQLQVARLLRALALVIEKAGPDEISALLKGQAVLSKVTTRQPESSTQLDLTPSRPPDLTALSEKLHSLDSRDEGLAALASASLSRRDLEKLGRVVGVPVLKSDNVERLTQKIIEASIGARLSSEAIRGDRPKMGK